MSLAAAPAPASEAASEAASGAAGLAARLPAYALAVLALLGLDFALPLLMPGDAVTAFLGQDAMTELSDGQRRQMLQELGLGQPLWRQGLAWLGQLARLDLGYSPRHGMPVAALLAQHLPWTLLLTGCALALSLAAGMLLGLEAAFFQPPPSHPSPQSPLRWLDRALTAAMLALQSLPAFAVAMGLALLFAHGLPWFPASGAAAPFSQATGLQAVLERAHHLALPVAALALPAAARLFLITRAAAVALRGAPFMEMALAKGASPLALRWRHLAPNVWAVALARLGGMGARLMAGGIYVETVFAYPGINLLLTDAIARHDYPLVRGVLLASGLLALALNLAADALAARYARRTQRLA
ncbi:ABC transporter permease [Ottowia massiliensis]|uniref:ABC transporter permease n=1 Tax=Ottowia massiliensis TaxID=2045302 RepID=UPI000C860044|nr:ABC transporter permease [Ottowia massiliensis]